MVTFAAEMAAMELLMNPTNQMGAVRAIFIRHAGSALPPASNAQNAAGDL
ncbi:MAG: hypothetical protein KC496_23110 [Anaerolineae bacterium]|nr:hypothetical protein [Anaerolineae bacterium]